MHRFMRGLLAAVVAVIMTTQPLLAANVGANNRGFVCADGVCQVRLNLGVDDGWLQVAEAAVSRLPDGLMAVAGEVMLALPAGRLQLADADLRLTLDETGRVATLRGAALLPVPTLGLLGDAQLVTPARVELGVELGRELVHLQAPLDPARRYFFVDLQAGAGLMVGGIGLDVPVGQRATLVVDFTAPLVFIDGTVTLRSDGQVALVREWLAGGDAIGLPSELPLRQLATFHLQGQVGRGVEPRLVLESSLRVDGGWVNRWLRIDATPLLASGQVVLGPLGIHIAGALESSIAPEHVVYAAAQAEAFVPYAAPETAALTLQAQGKAPPLELAYSGRTELAGAPGWPAVWTNTAWTGLAAGVEWVGTRSAAGTAWTRAQASDGATWLANGATQRWTATQAHWCDWTGWCEAELAATAGLAGAWTE